jgi:hypothetical protein
MNFPFLQAKERLIRIMGTFDLATGHANTFDELLDSLELELRDVLGHYREALKKNQSEPTAQPEPEPIQIVDGVVRPVPWTQREWQGLTGEEVEEVERWVEFKEEGSGRIPTGKLIRYIEAKLKEKNSD